jgi:hypothetical protein
MELGKITEVTPYDSLEKSNQLTGIVSSWAQALERCDRRGAQKCLNPSDALTVWREITSRS